MLASAPQDWCASNNFAALKRIRLAASNVDERFGDLLQFKSPEYAVRWCGEPNGGFRIIELPFDERVTKLDGVLYQVVELMQVKIRSCSRISLRCLVSAFPMRITSYGGHYAMTRRGFHRTLEEGRVVDIPAFEPIDLHVGGSLFSASTCHIELDDRRSAVIGRAIPSDFDTSRQEGHLLRELISATVFHDPQRDWNAELVASVLHTTANSIRRTLFTQGAALTEICRTQRLMRALFESMQVERSVSDLKALVGWVRSDLEESFYERFGVSLQTVSRLRRGGL